MSLAERTRASVAEPSDGSGADGRWPSVGDGTPALRHVLVGLDATAVFAAWFVTYMLLPAVHDGRNGLTATLTRSVILTGVSLMLLAGQRLYRSNVCSSRIVELRGLARAAMFAALVSLIAYRVSGAGRRRRPSSSAASSAWSCSSASVASTTPGCGPSEPGTLHPPGRRRRPGRRGRAGHRTARAPRRPRLPRLRSRR